MTAKSSRVVIAASLLAAALIGWAAWDLQRRFGGAGEADELRIVADRVLAEYSRGLPKPFGPGLIIERVGFEERDLVMTLRSERPGIDATLSDPAMRERVRAAEHREMLPLCANRDVLFLLARGGTISRRFVDAAGRPYFTVTLSATDCAAASRIPVS